MLKTLLTCSVLFLCAISQADEIDYCRVTSVNDGNSFRCISDKNQNFEVTLHRIKTPKLDQPYGKEAKALLSAIILNKKIDVVDVEFKGKQTEDGYQIIAATLWADVAEEEGVVDINQFMIAKGLATYDHSSSLEEQKTYIALEEDAKQAKLGLWSQSDSAPLVKGSKAKKE